MFRTFIRTWWKENPAWHNGLEPHAGPKNYTGDEYEDEDEARKASKAYNTTHDPGRYSEKMEFEEF